ncbi:PP2C family serine/threonine-protein phosphatase [Bacillus xiapuensis]|uniref:PP2C family serine/threonine-protein phosphatase n=1 Tax=Bacillus xiapuensis TaxID=2014075 RepID=UPI000C23E8D9|nr:PP2C family serine/threonine-protein phosphatase [Bacillus xiapuensis]
MTHLQSDHIEVYATQTAKNNNFLCGDSYFIHETEDYLICVLADGLGSGEFAYESAAAVTKVVEDNHQETVDCLMSLSNDVLQQKRGAAVAIFKADFKRQEFEYSCVGNIRFYLYTEDGKLTYPLPVTGYLSGRPQVYRTRRFAYETNCKFLLHSDGVQLLNVKSLLQNRSIHQIAYILEGESMQTNDDSTFIIGSLLK